MWSSCCHCLARACGQMPIFPQADESQSPHCFNLVPVPIDFMCYHWRHFIQSFHPGRDTKEKWDLIPPYEGDKFYPRVTYYRMPLTNPDYLMGNFFLFFFFLNIFSLHGLVCELVFWDEVSEGTSVLTITTGQLLWDLVSLKLLLLRPLPEVIPTNF